MQPGDVLETFADVEDLIATPALRRQRRSRTGFGNFVTWYRDYFKV